MKPRLLGGPWAVRMVACGFALSGCSAGKTATPEARGRDAGAESVSQSSQDIGRRIASAEDRRQRADLPLEAQTSRDPAQRRSFARALARIRGAGLPLLLRSLEDEDSEVVAFAAYGVGKSCAEDGIPPGPNVVSALAARLFALRATGVPPPMAAASTPPPKGAAAPHESTGTPTIRADWSILRALGRCGGDLASGALLPSLQADPETAEVAAYALGDVATRRGSLTPLEAGALLDAASRSPPLDAALFAFGRAEVHIPAVSLARLALAAHAALSRPGPVRVFAVRARGRAGDAEAAAELARILISDDATSPERVEAAHALGKLDKVGQAALAGALVALAPAVMAVPFSPDYAVVRSVLGALHGETPSNAERVLWSLARWAPPNGAPPGILRRLAELRCAAAMRLARGVWDADILSNCDVGDGQAGEGVRIEVLSRRFIDSDARAAWGTLAKSPHVRTRQAALQLIARHPELLAPARAVLSAALSDPEPGVAATAARILRDEAARLDPDGTVRTRAAALLAALGAGDGGAPDPLPAASIVAPVAHPIADAVRVALDTEAGPLGIRFDPTFSPLAVTRFLALVRSGFYDGTSFHRVVPGFVVQFGARAGDGFAGSGDLLRPELAPVPFRALDVGIALVGQDAESSQIFVALVRSPHVDGEFAWAGHADGDWNAVTEGDILRSAIALP